MSTLTDTGMFRLATSLASTNEPALERMTSAIFAIPDCNAGYAAVDAHELVVLEAEVCCE